METETGIKMAKLPQISILIMFAMAKAAEARSEKTAADLSRCGGNSLASYIGKPVAEMERLNLAPMDARFICQPGCVATADVRATRLTVIYSEKTKRVTNMHCE
jgi:hypothetical protein